MVHGPPTCKRALEKRTLCYLRIRIGGIHDRFQSSCERVLRYAVRTGTCTGTTHYCPFVSVRADVRAMTPMPMLIPMRLFP